jgi:hypothetical protein
MTERVPCVLSPSKQKVVTALGKFLMNVPLENQLSFLASIGVRYTISGNARGLDKGSGFHECKIFIQEKHEGQHVTVEKYTGTNGRSVKGAVANAMAKFFVAEEHDYHDYKALFPDVSNDDAVI